MDGSHAFSSASVSEAVTQRIGFSPPPLRTLHGASSYKRHARVVGGVSKRAFDIVASASALLVLSPVLSAIWLAVRLESPGPGFFRQRRGGFQGRPFHIFKFRTMRTCESRVISQAKKEDDRTTRLGRFLRKTSIDELPQLINVLLGHMSIVGPRPHALAHDRQFSAIDRRYVSRHHARPGITGHAQISGARGATETREKVMERTTYDLHYVRNWSWAMDIKIIINTPLALLRNRNVF